MEGREGGAFVIFVDKDHGMYSSSLQPGAKSGLMLLLMTSTFVVVLWLDSVLVFYFCGGTRQCLCGIAPSDGPIVLFSG